LRQGLRDLGWVEGENLTIEYRVALVPCDVRPSQTIVLDDPPV
jgi:hypothetical protein